MRFKVTLLSLFLLSSFAFLLFLFFNDIDRRTLLYIRLPEAFLSFSFGSVLGITGALYQGVFKNPLASPYILGVSAGAAFGATLAVFLSFSPSFGAVLGSFSSVLLLKLFSYFFRTSIQLLLFGVGINAFLSSLILLIYSVMPSYALQDAFYYTLGYITPLPLKSSLFLFLLSLLSLFSFLPFGRWVDALALGKLGLFSGVKFEREGIFLLFLGAFFLSFFVGIVGIVGFVGIVVPHVGKLLGFRRLRELLPVSYFIGGSLLLISQLLAKTLLSPTVLPVGTVTALLGVPFFLFLLWREGRA